MATKRAERAVIYLVRESGSGAYDAAGPTGGPSAGLLLTGQTSTQAAQLVQTMTVFRLDAGAARALRPS